jgi:diguanylate cyclase (GGDEF)-like protein
VCLVAVTALLAEAAALLSVAMPLVDGWAICTLQNGVVLALLLTTRRRNWAWILIGYAVGLSLGDKVSLSILHLSTLQVFGNLLEVCLAAFTLPPFRNLKQWLQEPRLLPAFLGYAMFAGPSLMALTMASHLSLAGAGSGFWPRVGTVALSEAIGLTLTTATLLVLLNRQTYALFNVRQLPQTIGLLALAGLAPWFAVHSGSSGLLVLAPMAVLLVITFQMGLRAAVLGVAITCAVAAVLNHHANGGAPDLAATTQILFATAIFGIMPLGVILKRKYLLEERLLDAHVELDKLKSLDRLTGVPNRKRFDLVLDREWQRATRDPKHVALLIVDVDHFDSYNQHYGPQAGDECLRLVAARMTEQRHRAYDLISRYEGGKFTVLLPGASGEAVERIAEEFRAEIAGQAWPHVQSPFERITVSVGWASLIPTEDTRPGALIAAAESALRIARANGNHVAGVDAKADVVISA